MNMKIEKGSKEENLNIIVFGDWLCVRSIDRSINSGWQVQYCTLCILPSYISEGGKGRSAEIMNADRSTWKGVPRENLGMNDDGALQEHWAVFLSLVLFLFLFFFLYFFPGE